MGPPDIPRVGQGTWPITDREDCIDMITTGLEIGYRHIDTAEMYDNEALIGDALAQSDVPREEVFLATKIMGSHCAYDDVFDAAAESARKLGVDTIDLLYVHFPRGEYEHEETLPAFDELKDRGDIQHIGLSNFTVEWLAEALEVLEHDLYAHQVETHPLMQQRALRELAAERDFHHVSHTPLARGKVFDVDLLVEIAEKHETTAAQVGLAWMLAKDMVVIPKSTDPDHLRENFEARSLELDADDVERIDSLLEFRQERINNPTNPAWKWQRQA